MNDVFINAKMHDLIGKIRASRLSQKRSSRRSKRRRTQLVDSSANDVFDDLNLEVVCLMFDVEVTRRQRDVALQRVLELNEELRSKEEGG